MSNDDATWIGNYIWAIGDDVLRDLYVRGKYRDVILPMKVVEQDSALRAAAGQAFDNTSEVHAGRPPGRGQPAAARGRLSGLPRRILAQRAGHSRELRVPQPDFATLEG